MPKTCPADILEVIKDKCKEYGTPLPLALAVCETESHFNKEAKSPVGALGLFQLMPKTAAWLDVNPVEWIDNIEGGVKYLKRLISMFPGRIDLVAAAYNAGPGSVRAYHNTIPPFPETQNYVTKVITALHKYDPDFVLNQTYHKDDPEEKGEK